MCFKYLLVLTLSPVLAVFLNSQTFAMGGKPEVKPIEKVTEIDTAPASAMTLKELAHIYWPDSDATQLQREETLKKLLGKKVAWEITVAQIQCDGDGYLIQGQSDKDMLGTFSYVKPRNNADEEQIQKARMGDTLPIVGIVKDMDMRHIILQPAFIQSGN